MMRSEVLPGMCISIVIFIGKSNIHLLLKFFISVYLRKCEVNKVRVAKYVNKLKKEYVAEQIERSEMYKRTFAEMCHSQEEREDDGHASD